MLQVDHQSCNEGGQREVRMKLAGNCWLLQQPITVLLGQRQWYIFANGYSYTFSQLTAGLKQIFTRQLLIQKESGGKNLSTTCTNETKVLRL